MGIWAIVFPSIAQHSIAHYCTVLPSTGWVFGQQLVAAGQSSFSQSNGVLFTLFPNELTEW